MKFKQSSTSRKNVWVGHLPISKEVKFVKKKTIKDKEKEEYNLCRVVPFQIVNNQDLFYHLEKPDNTNNFEQMLESILTEFLLCS